MERNANTKDNTETSSVTLTMTYNHTLSNIEQIIQNHWPILKTNKALEKIFSIWQITGFAKTKAWNNSLEEISSKIIIR